MGRVPAGASLAVSRMMIAGEVALSWSCYSILDLKNTTSPVSLYFRETQPGSSRSSTDQAEPITRRCQFSA
jgi:hypothetical protein